MTDTLEPTNLIEDMMLDYSIFSLKYIGYSQWYIYERWIRS